MQELIVLRSDMGRTGPGLLVDFWRLTSRSSIIRRGRFFFPLFQAPKRHWFTLISKAFSKYMSNCLRNNKTSTSTKYLLDVEAIQVLILQIVQGTSPTQIIFLSMQLFFSRRQCIIVWDGIARGTQSQKLLAFLEEIELTKENVGNFQGSVSKRLLDKIRT